MSLFWSLCVSRKNRNILSYYDEIAFDHSFLCQNFNGYGWQSHKYPKLVISLIIKCLFISSTDSFLVLKLIKFCCMLCSYVWKLIFLIFCQASIAQLVQHLSVAHEVLVSSPTNACSQVCGRDQLGCHTGHQEVGRCHTRGESWWTWYTYIPLLSANKASYSCC